MDVSKNQNARRSNGRCMDQFEVFLADKSGRFILVQVLRNSGEYKTSFLRINTVVTMTNVIVSTYDAKFDLYILKSTDFTEIKLFPKSIYLREAKAEFDDWMKRNPNIINSLSERLADFKDGRPIVRQHSAGKAEATLTYSENQNLAPAHSENSMLHSASSLNLPSPPSLPPYNFIPRMNDKIDWVDYFLDALDRNPSESSEDFSKSKASGNRNATGEMEFISHSPARYLECKSHSLLGYVEKIQISLENNLSGQLIQSLDCTVYFDSGVNLLKLNSTISSVLPLLISCISESIHSFSPSSCFNIQQFQLNPKILLTSTSTHPIDQVDADNVQNVDTWISAFDSTRSKIWSELGITKLPIQEYLRWWICNARVYSSKSLVDGYNEMRATKSELSVDEYLCDISIKRETGHSTSSEYIQVGRNKDKYNLVILEGELMNLIDCLNQFTWKDYVEIEVAESTAKVDDQRDATGTEPSTGLVLKKLEMVDTSSRFHQLLSLLYTEENRV
ncbi:hypothetical protein BKA69DRAFT_322251 [Paraphysoderma sedebokerense]|nr:hypothetical protein BKA69DRAFT_322251 [Paraphysoderma sedebokerense]